MVVLGKIFGGVKFADLAFVCQGNANHDLSVMTSNFCKLLARNKVSAVRGYI
jgi:hypothetical protein